MESSFGMDEQTQNKFKYSKNKLVRDNVTSQQCRDPSPQQYREILEIVISIEILIYLMYYASARA